MLQYLGKIMDRYLIAGLGNPGREYEATRHNMGFQTIDLLAKQLNLIFNREDFHGIYVKGVYKDKEIYLLEPLTYMNLSGQSVMELSHYFKIPNENIIIIFDDMDTEVGKLRLREKGSSGGHNGIKSIIQMLHDEEIKRVKIGIGRPKGPYIDYVLSIPSDEEQVEIKKAQEKACTLILEAIDKGFHYAVSRV